MKKVIVVLGLAIASSVFSQDVNSQRIQELKYNSIDLNKNGLIDKAVEGSPYLMPQFLTGTVLGFPDSYKMRYNAYLDEVDFQKDGETLALLKENLYGTIHFIETNETLKLENYNYNKSSILGYLFLIANKNDITIFKKSSIIYAPFKAAKTSYDTDFPATYKKVSDVYFIKNGNSEIVELPSNKRKLIAMFPDKKEAITQYFKNNRVDLSNSKDLQKLVEIL